ncbi:LysR family transcriptional regulator [Lactiplantibacillus fabifermentans]|uniref:Transcription regulator n=2 Tax=Lactiplantibacillus fabifermentans TaxID=483011 RepID=A0A0R2NJ01_9LACO|nr:LysR family transcriptional regulator [Lactiplantibacillus fabifermentans]ETY74203.1 LysR family transcriptional regulator [Lactiplantibacillus fabifermentans T30PCM01]KRO24834.1 transcription regulator [Lactiplantibacillus fabifermentans DSM 21115]
MKTTQESIFSSKTLTYFLQLAETMNYTQAAQILGITQPALTQQIKKLERTVGAPLFYSVGKKLRLSDAGYTMLNATHSIYNVLNKATDEIQQTTSATQGSINIGILASIEDHVFEDFAIKYYEANPNVIISFHMLTRKEIWERLENNRIDLAVMYLPDESIKNWKPYQSKRIIQDELLFITSDPKQAKKKRIKFKDTTGEPWAMYPENYYLDQVIKESYKNQLADLPTAVARFTTPQQIFRFVAATGTNTALPNSFMVANPAAENLHTVSFEPAIKFDLNFVFRQDKDQIPRIKNFLDEFDNYLRSEDYISRLQKINQK